MFRNIPLYIPGFLLFTFGIYLAIFKPHIKFATNVLREYLELVDGKPGYIQWHNHTILFKVTLFHFTNPKEIMRGEAPIIEERGPYVYNSRLEKKVSDVNEETDEITYTLIKHYQFNKILSGKNSPDDTVVVLNSAYLGIMNTLNVKAPFMLPQLGNNIKNLFPKIRDIFLREKVKNILFDGLPLICDPEKFPDLSMICTVLKMQKPSMLKDGDVEGTYTYSLFGELNGTEQGPFNVNRGIKNKDALGNTTSFKNLRIGKYWNTEACNSVSGTDAITWPPMNERWPYVVIYEPTICRSSTGIYKRDEIYFGMVGHRYETDATYWSESNMACYCSLTKKHELDCLPTGLMNIAKCQEAEVIYSEPHYLHGDPDLLDYAKGLTPDPQLHTSYIVLDPLTGAPLSGSKKIQLNVQIKPFASVTMLSNVTMGYCPVFWVEETINPASIKTQLSPVINFHRVIQVIRFLTWIPIILGIFYIFCVSMIQTVPENDVISIDVQAINKNRFPNQQYVKQAGKRRNNAAE